MWVFWKYFEKKALVSLHHSPDLSYSFLSLLVCFLSSAFVDQTINEVKGLFWSSQVNKFPFSKHHENSRLLSAHLQPLHFWALGPCQVSLKSLEEGRPSNPIPASKCKWHHTEKGWWLKWRMGDTVTLLFPPPISFYTQPVTGSFPKRAQQHLLVGASSVLAPVGFCSAKLLAQLGWCLFSCSSAWNFHSQSSIELHPFFWNSCKA